MTPLGIARRMKTAIPVRVVRSNVITLVLFVCTSIAGSVSAQDTDFERAGPAPIDSVASTEEGAAEQSDTPDSAKQTKRLSLLWLITKGGTLMIPIGVLSVLLVALVIERGLSLRRTKVMPQGLMSLLSDATAVPGGFDPRHVYRLCQQYPSTASTVVRTMLLKVGRPQSEVEHTCTEVCQREADRMYANVRWMNLIAAVAPLLGLFGTVWGMINAFYETTQLAPDQNKAEYLASGIYVALVTTLGGLAVAIPAAVSAHYFEGRIHAIFHQIEELLFSLMPQIERYEGRLRVSRETLDGKSSPSSKSADSPVRPPSVATVSK